MPTWLVTGGAGFIGGNFVLDAVRNGVRIVNLDALTYAGNRDTLAALEGNADYRAGRIFPTRRRGNSRWAPGPALYSTVPMPTPGRYRKDSPWPAASTK